MERIFRRGDETLTVSVRREGDRLHLDRGTEGRTFVWEELGPGDYLLRQDGRQWRCVVARAGDDRWVWIDGQVHQLKVASATRKRSAAPAGELSAPMPGQVLRVLVEPGAAVRKDQVLVVLEAMKMQYEIVAPRDGIVKSVQAAAGTQVAGGLALVTLEEDASE